MLFKKGGNPVNETSGLELYVEKKEKRTMFYYRVNTKEQLAKANCLAPGKGEERFVRSKVEIRVLDIKT